MTYRSTVNRVDKMKDSTIVRGRSIKTIDQTIKIDVFK